MVSIWGDLIDRFFDKIHDESEAVQSLRNVFCVRCLGYLKCGFLCPRNAPYVLRLGHFGYHLSNLVAVIKLISASP